MNTQELLQELSDKVSRGEVMEEDIYRILKKDTVSSKKTGTITKVLYGIGAVIVLIGIIIFFGQVWEDIGAVARVIVTLGLGIVMAVSGSILLKNRSQHMIGSVFHVIGGVLIPSGLLVLLSELGESDSLWPITFVFLATSILYGLLMVAHRKLVLTSLFIINVTVFIYLLMGALLENASANIVENAIIAISVFLGVSYLLASHSFINTWNEKLRGPLNLLGSAFVLVAMFNKMFSGGVWELIYVAILVAGISVSVFVRSKAILATTTIALISYVTYITGQYFADSFGWPITLISLGFVFIALGYFSVAFGKRYIEG